ncbi:MAG TPA: DNA repair protein RadA [Tissierellaceae bacterium]
MKGKVKYICSSCGYESVGHLGKCPMCNSWGTLEKTVVTKEDEKREKRASVFGKKEVKKLTEITTSNSDRIKTDLGEFNRVMGGGIVKDSVTILAAKPGAGKSTLLLQVANNLAKNNHKVLYASGEESESQIRSRADRILDKIEDNLLVVSDNSMDNVITYINDNNPDIIIIDSIQTFTLAEYSSSRAGSPTQTMECAHEMVRIAKDETNPRVVFMIGQMTKEDELAGVRALEHLVDTVLIIEGDSGEELRTLLATKNRYGSTGEMGFFNITEDGMVSIDNPSEYFMTDREKEDLVYGNAITVVREGTRPIILEVESLVSQSFTPYPSRIGECMRREHLNTLVSILEERGGIKLYDKNVVIKTTGGMQLKEQAANLAVIMSIASSVNQKSIANDVVFIADVGLTGELKKVPSLDQRLKEVDRIGFKYAIVAPGSARNRDFENLNVIEFKTLKDVLKTYI